MLGDDLRAALGNGTCSTTLNKHSMSYGELALSTKVTVLVAECTSRLCAGELRRVVKHLAIQKDRCPDCGHYLFFKRVRGKVWEGV